MCYLHYHHNFYLNEEVLYLLALSIISSSTKRIELKASDMQQNDSLSLPQRLPAVQLRTGLFNPTSNPTGRHDCQTHHTPEAYLPD